ncbi:hypothetical protein LC55x_0694 [Lysobacter capsici]|uniref:Uncharacterized protein n=1 Tax=Lysobacter capsici AZ78 TaxID=1444315 RepID=A0A125MMY0_9GAMM|nr:hypothetical protein LC55x_0694 [Lysobacter capsici]KWS04823.1 hypothetical protein AZ78_2373 [Lysobacter capsici AZ78]
MIGLCDLGTPAGARRGWTVGNSLARRAQHKQARLRFSL